VAKVRLSDIALSKCGGLQEGLIVVAIANVEGLTKGNQYVLYKTMNSLRPIYYVRNDKGQACSEMKFFVHLKDWREKQLGDLGI
jgi:hypothetical protein